MGATAETTGLRTRIARAFRSAEPAVPLQRLDCVADVQIGENHVVPALHALTETVPSLHRYLAGSSASLTRARSNLVEALRATGQDAKRSSHDVGVTLLEAHGSPTHLAAVYAALAPFIGEGSFVQINSGGESHYWTFDGGHMVSNDGEHPSVHDLAADADFGDFGAA